MNLSNASNFDLEAGAEAWRESKFNTYMDMVGFEVEEITEDLIEFGFITIRGGEIHIMDLHDYCLQYEADGVLAMLGLREDLGQLLLMTIRNQESARAHSIEIVKRCANYYFGEAETDLAGIYYEEKHSEY